MQWLSEATPRVKHYDGFAASLFSTWFSNKAILTAPTVLHSPSHGAPSSPTLPGRRTPAGHGSKAPKTQDTDHEMIQPSTWFGP